MAETWITADYHLGEDRFKIMQRPFTTTDEMVATLVKNHNELVNPNDLVIINGDVCYQKHPEWLEQITQFNGRKTLIRGNHDRVFTDEQLAPYFETIIPEGEGIMLSVDHLKCWVTHYPSRAKEEYFNLVGHIHGAWKYQLNSLNVGVDVHNFCPVNIKEVSFFHLAITKFYDDDVWAAYHPANEKYKGLRGITGSYIDNK